MRDITRGTSRVCEVIVELYRRRSADTNLAEIHEEMSELLDKQVNI